MVFKLSTFMIGIALLSGFVVTFAGFYSNINDNYDVNYDNSTINSMNKLENIKNISEEIEDRHKTDTNNKDLIDVLGNLIADGIDIARLGTNSYGAMLEMKDVTFEKLGISNVWSVIVFVVIIIIMFVAIILRIKVGADV